MTRDRIVVEREYEGERCGDCDMHEYHTDFASGERTTSCAAFDQPLEGFRGLRCPACLSTPGQPGPTDAAVREAFQYFDDLRGEWSDEQLEDHLETLLSYVRAVQSPRLIQHPDDLAVDLFTAAMKEKLAQKRAEGRDGWNDPDKCSVGFLVSLLHGHVQKGDPVDIGNIVMMLWNRGVRGNRAAFPELADGYQVKP